MSVITVALDDWKHCGIGVTLKWRSLLQTNTAQCQVAADRTRPKADTLRPSTDTNIPLNIITQRHEMRWYRQFAIHFFAQFILVRTAQYSPHAMDCKKKKV